MAGEWAYPTVNFIRPVYKALASPRRRDGASMIFRGLSKACHAKTVVNVLDNHQLFSGDVKGEGSELLPFPRLS